MQRFILHPEYHNSQEDMDPDAPPRLENDIALVILDEPVTGVSLQQLADNGTVGRGRGSRRWAGLGRQCKLAGAGVRAAATVLPTPLLSPAVQALEPGQALLTAGWGRVPGATALSPNPNTLLATELEAVDLDECRDW